MIGTIEINEKTIILKMEKVGMDYKALVSGNSAMAVPQVITYKTYELMAEIYTNSLPLFDIVGKEFTVTKVSVA